MTRRPAAERLFTPAFIALGVADLCYFTGFGIAIFALPLYVTGPVGGGEAAGRAGLRRVRTVGVRAAAIRRATVRPPRPPALPRRRSSPRRHKPRVARPHREHRRDRRAPPPRRRGRGRVLRRRFRSPRRRCAALRVWARRCRTTHWGSTSASHSGRRSARSSCARPDSGSPGPAPRHWPSSRPACA